MPKSDERLSEKRVAADDKHANARAGCLAGSVNELGDERQAEVQVVVRAFGHLEVVEDAFNEAPRPEG
ncbi:MAG: hypothetical protein ABIU97_00075 [Dehalococcoidia bacterium]